MIKSQVLSEEIAVMKTEISYLKVGVDKISGKLDAFIEAADSKYATKEEVAELKKDTDWNKEKILELVYKVGVVAGLIYLTFGGNAW